MTTDIRNKNKEYECHVTYNPKFTFMITAIAEKHGFKTSVLKGDEEMGDDKYLYCTTHDSTFEGIRQRMEALIGETGPIHLRKKIEHIILDERMGL